MRSFLSLILSLVVITGFSETYTFTGNGLWSVAGNWSNSTVPPQELPLGSTIYISPSPGDSCVLNITQSILPGASLIVSPGAKFIIPGISGIGIHPPTVTTTALSNIYSCSAASGGNVTSNGGSDVTARGVVWSTAPEPTIDLTTKTNDGTGSGSYGSFLSNLIPAAEYHVRAYATNAAGTAYGNELVFNTSFPLVNVITQNVVDIQATSAVSGGIVLTDNDPCVNIFQKGVVWNTTPNLDISLITKTIDGGGPISYQSFLNGLTPGTTYYAAAYLVTNTGIFYGQPIQFTTAGSATITTTTAIATSFTTATSGGHISYDGGASITARGVVWSTSPSPTIALSTKTNDGTGIGSYVSNITNLSANTTYYIRAYAVNSLGASYGDELSFSTNDINGFHGVKICDQVWMKENLSVSKYRNGDPIPQVTDYNEWMNLKTGAWCWYNNDSATYGGIYGRLYNWYAVNDQRGLAPAGWHISSDAEWSVLSTCLGGNSVAGGKMKEAGTSHWLTPNSSATNSSGFTGLGGGYRTDDGQGNFVNVKEDGYWWTSTPFDDYQSTIWTLYYADGELVRHLGDQKYRGNSVRCIAGDFPTVNTTAPSGLTDTTATSGGNVINEGSAPVIARGVVWSALPNPTIALSTKTVDGSGAGNFVSHLAGLSPNTNYHIRAYATNSFGTWYGTDYNFNTPTSLPADTLICSQRWTTQNLTVSNYKNGDPIPQVTDRTQWAALTTGAWCWYNNDSATYAVYGKLYNWYAVNDPRGLAPAGWHIPNEIEWNTLYTCLGGADVAGGKMKEAGTSHWQSPNNGATNSSGFTALPAGITDYNTGAFGELGFNGHWWTATSYDNIYAYLAVLRTNLVSAGVTTTPKNRGLSVRLIKN